MGNFAFPNGSLDHRRLTKAQRLAYMRRAHRRMHNARRPDGHEYAARTTAVIRMVGHDQ